MPAFEDCSCCHKACALTAPSCFSQATLRSRLYCTSFSASKNCCCRARLRLEQYWTNLTNYRSLDISSPKLVSWLLALRSASGGRMCARARKPRAHARVEDGRRKSAEWRARHISPTIRHHLHLHRVYQEQRHDQADHIIDGLEIIESLNDGYDLHSQLARSSKPAS